MALKLKELFTEKAKENHSKVVIVSNITRRNPYYQKSENMEPKPINTAKELAKIAGVSHDSHCNEGISRFLY